MIKGFKISNIGTANSVYIEWENYEMECIKAKRQE